MVNRAGQPEKETAPPERSQGLGGGSYTHRDGGRAAERRPFADV